MTGLTYWSVTTWQGYRFHSFKNPKQVWHHHLLTLWHHQLIADQEVKMVRSPVDLMTCLGHMRYETLPLNPTSTSSCPVLVTLAKSKHVIVILVQSWWHLQKANMSLSFWSFTGDTCKTSRSMLLCLLLVTLAKANMSLSFWSSSGDASFPTSKPLHRSTTALKHTHTNRQIKTKVTLMSNDFNKCQG